MIAKVELFHLLDSPMASTANPFKTAANIIKSQGWLHLFDGIGRELILRVYYKSFIPRQFPKLDYFVGWILNSATAFWETKTIPNRSHIRKWFRAGFYFSKHYNFDSNYYI